MLTSIILNYLILGGSIIILSYFLKLPHQYLLGFIILASVPPAVAVIPFTNFLGGNLDYSIVGFLSSYIGAFIFTPFILSLFLGSIPSFQSKLYLLLIELIIIPFILSRILIYFNIEERIVNYKGTFINWSFFIIIYTIVGLNNEVFLRNPFSLGSLIIISFLTTFLLGYFIELFFKKINFDSDKITSYILLGTSKNSGFAAGLALTLISVESTVPSTITTIFMLIFFIYLDIKRKYSL
ncbi:hypothetical protein JW865_01865 [Candidatus Bathyarchaeota archaeon]|nr:hypothetical protein [Candidatus Bathyarchaeota archaeon]